MSKIARSLLPVLILLLSQPVFSQSPLTSDQLRRIHDLVVRDVPEGAPGVAFGIVRNGEVLYTDYSGFANLDDSLRIDEHTRFNIASNGKQFTALAVLTLVEEGKLDLTEDIRAYFPTLLPAIKESLTLQHLLTHTSGIRDVYDLLSLQGITWWKQTLDNQDMIDLLNQQQDLNFPPGTEYLYSNSNYILLAEIVARVSQESFSDYSQQLFQTLGMPDTRFEADFSLIREPVARPYFNFQTWTTYDWTWNVVGDGNLFTTLADQLRYEQLLHTSRPAPISGDLLQRSQQRLTDDVDYGFGVEFSTYLKHPVVFHHGGTGAWKATVMRFPERRLSLITVSNSGKTDVVDQNQAIADILLQIDPAAEPAYAIAPDSGGSLVTEDQITGVYRDEQGSTFQFEEREEGLFLLREGRNDVLLEREGPNVFHQLFDPAFKQEFLTNEADQLTVTAYYPTHPPYTLAKIKADFSGFDPASLEGVYVNAETAVSIELKHLGDRTYTVIRNERESTGLLLTPDTMTVNGYTMVFDAEGNFFLDGDRIRRVAFRKR